MLVSVWMVRWFLSHYSINKCSCILLKIWQYFYQNDVVCLLIFEWLGGSCDYIPSTTTLVFCQNLSSLICIMMSFSLQCFLTWFLQVKKHIKQGQGHEGGIFTVEAPLHASNVQVLDPVTGYALVFEN